MREQAAGVQAAEDGALSVVVAVVGLPYRRVVHRVLAVIGLVSHDAPRATRRHDTVADDLSQLLVSGLVNERIERDGRLRDDIKARLPPHLLLLYEQLSLFFLDGVVCVAGPRTRVFRLGLLNSILCLVLVFLLRETKLFFAVLFEVCELIVHDPRLVRVVVLAGGCVVAINALFERLSAFNLVQGAQWLLQREILYIALKASLLHAEDVLELVDRDGQRLTLLRYAAHCRRVSLVPRILEADHGVVQEKQFIGIDNECAYLVFGIKWRTLRKRSHTAHKLGRLGVLIVLVFGV